METIWMVNFTKGSTTIITPTRNQSKTLIKEMIAIRHLNDVKTHSLIYHRFLLIISIISFLSLAPFVPIKKMSFLGRSSRTAQLILSLHFLSRRRDLYKDFTVNFWWFCRLWNTYRVRRDSTDSSFQKAISLIIEVAKSWFWRSHFPVFFMFCVVYNRIFLQTLEDACILLCLVSLLWSHLGSFIRYFYTWKHLLIIACF